MTITQQAMIRAEMVLGRIDLDPTSRASVVEAKAAPGAYIGLRTELTKPVTVWMDPPQDALSGTPKDVLFWELLMRWRPSGLLKHAIFVKRGGLVTSEVERPAQFLACYPRVSPSRRLIPSYRNELQLIYVPGLIDNSLGFKKAFQDFGILVHTTVTKEVHIESDI